MKTTRHFEENNTSFYAKQHVTLKKTTRRFEENKPAFYTKVPIDGNKEKIQQTQPA